jgi:VWFA-related protein
MRPAYMKLLAAGALLPCCLEFAPAQKDQPPTFQTGVDLVMTAVVVHDAHGRAAGNLRAEDFAIFDKGKPQKIASFQVERLSAPAAAEAAKAGEAVAPAGTGSAPVERYVAYVFDDLQLKGDALIRVRQAASAHLASLRPGDHAAIFTTSGGLTHPFTTSTDELQRTLLKLSPSRAEGGRNCPDLSFYESDLILNKHDNNAVMAALYEVQACAPALSPAYTNPNTPPNITTAKDPGINVVNNVAKAVFSAGRQLSGIALETLGNVVGYLSAAPGQRILALASPGFLTAHQDLEKDALMDRALRSQVVIDSLDARGLYVNPGVELTKHISNPRSTMSDFPYASVKGELANRAAQAQTAVLAELAAGTGGAFFEHNNDLLEGFRQTSSAPEYLYLIGFTPEKLKLDGSFHALKVELKNQPDLKVHSARKGYAAGQAR